MAGGVQVPWNRRTVPSRCTKPRRPRARSQDRPFDSGTVEIEDRCGVESSTDEPACTAWTVRSSRLARGNNTPLACGPEHAAMRGRAVPSAPRTFVRSNCARHLQS
jgi:hypothetical protein